MSNNVEEDDPDVRPHPMYEDENTSEAKKQLIRESIN